MIVQNTLNTQSFKAHSGLTSKAKSNAPTSELAFGIKVPNTTIAKQRMIEQRLGLIDILTKLRTVPQCIKSAAKGGEEYFGIVPKKDAVFFSEIKLPKQLEEKGHISVIDSLYGMMVEQMGKHQKAGKAEYLEGGVSSIAKEANRAGKLLKAVAEKRVDMVNGNTTAKTKLFEKLDKIIANSPETKGKPGAAKYAKQLKESVEAYHKEPYQPVGMHTVKKYVTEHHAINPFLGPFSPTFTTQKAIHHQNPYARPATITPKYMEEYAAKRESARGENLLANFKE